MIKKKGLILGLVCATLLSVAGATDTNANAAVTNGWEQSNNSWYYYQNGNMLTGWIVSGNARYHLKSNGVMDIGWIQDNNNWYYLKPDGTLAVNTTIDGYKVGATGAWIPSGATTTYTGTSIIPKLLNMGYFKNDFGYDTLEQQVTLNPAGKSGNFNNDQITISAFPNGEGDREANDMVIMKFRNDTDTNEKFNQLIKLVMPDHVDEIVALANGADTSISLGGRTIVKQTGTRGAILRMSPIIA